VFVKMWVCSLALEEVAMRDLELEREVAAVVHDREPRSFTAYMHQQLACVDAVAAKFGWGALKATLAVAPVYADLVRRPS
jgi:hypothetical protein